MCAATERWLIDAGLSPDVMCDVTPPSHLRLPSTSRAPRDARTFLAGKVCPLHTRPAVIETAALLVSELVTNAVRHAAPPVTLTIGCARAWLVVEVSDGSSNLPRRAAQAGPNSPAQSAITGAHAARVGRAAADDRELLDAAAIHDDLLDEGGRGIPLVAALSSEWGSRPAPRGKVTWFRLAL
jgi:anti-sigma regulatory factor (Ser/Thr protein kinase)